MLGGPDDPLPAKLARALYVDEEMDSATISRRTGLTVRQVNRRLHRYGIPRRPLRPAPGSPAAVLTRELLQKHYVEQRWSTRAIGAALGVSHSTVLEALHRHGFQLRTRTGGRPAAGHAQP